MITISANKLADFIVSKTPQRRQSIVRALRGKKADFAPYYTIFGGPAKRFLVDGASNHNEITGIIDFLKSRTETPWRIIDSRVTSEALKALLRLKNTLQGLNVSFAIPPKGKRPFLEYGEVKVTLHPDLLVHGARNEVPLLGALRFYLAKESSYQLGVRGAQLVAVMQYEWLTHVETRGRIPDPTLCMVMETFQQRITAAPSDPSNHISLIKRGCEDLARLWHDMDDKAA